MLETKNITKRLSHSNQVILDNISFSVREGEILSLLGPSGCGKTSLLKVLSGIDRDHSGNIFLHSKNSDLVMQKKQIENLKSQDRPFHMVFQRHALFPHLSVFENIAFGLRMKNVSFDEIQKRVGRMLEIIDMNDFAERMPETLSGGQSQRVAFARAAVNNPKVLLLDEPLSALDQKMREQMIVELRNFRNILGMAMIYVTHDQTEAFTLSDRIVVMNKGRVEQIGTPQQIYDQPETSFVSQFIGKKNRLLAEVVSADQEWVNFRLLTGNRKSMNQELIGKNVRQASFSKSEVIEVYIPVEKFSLGGSEESKINVISVFLTEQTFQGDRIEVQAQVAENLQILRFNSIRLLPSSLFADQNHVSLSFSHESTMCFQMTDNNSTSRIRQ